MTVALRAAGRRNTFWCALALSSGQCRLPSRATHGSPIRARAPQETTHTPSKRNARIRCASTKKQIQPTYSPTNEKASISTLWLMPVLLHGVRQRPRTDKARSSLPRRHLGANCVEFSLHRRKSLPFHPGDCTGRNDLSRAGDPTQRGRQDEKRV